MILDWTPRALRDLDKQLRFIERDKPSAADRMAELVERSTNMLIDWPQMGKIGRIHGTREFVIPKTPFVVYRVTASHVSIARLLHGAQKQK